jgi:hypothetical protein
MAFLPHGRVELDAATEAALVRAFGIGGELRRSDANRRRRGRVASSLNADLIVPCSASAIFRFRYFDTVPHGSLARWLRVRPQDDTGEGGNNREEQR